MATTVVKGVHGKAARKRQTAVPSRLMLRGSKISRWGSSLGIRIPQEAVRRLRLRAGERVSVEVRADSITVKPLRKRWTEAELLEGVAPEIVGGEIDWGGPVGREAW